MKKKKMKKKKRRFKTIEDGNIVVADKERLINTRRRPSPPPSALRNISPSCSTSSSSSTKGNDYLTLGPLQKIDFVSLLPEKETVAAEQIAVVDVILLFHFPLSLSLSRLLGDNGHDGWGHFVINFDYGWSTCGRYANSSTGHQRAPLEVTLWRHQQPVNSRKNHYKKFFFFFLNNPPSFTRHSKNKKNVVGAGLDRVQFGLGWVGVGSVDCMAPKLVKNPTQ